MRIIHVISDSNIGGAGRYLLNYLENSDRSNFEIKVVVPFKSKLIDEIKKLGFEYFEIDGLAEQSYNKIAVKQLYKIFKEQKPEIVHAHACLSARIAAKKCKAKIIYTRHTDAVASKKLTNPVGKVINGFVNGYLADGIIAVSNAARENLISTGINEKKIKVIFNGVPYEKKADEERIKQIYEQFGFVYDTKIVAIVARLEEIKGHEYFIDTAKIVSDRGYDVKFVIAGIGSREEFLKKYVQEKEVNNVVFLGFVKNVSELNNITFIQLNTSSYEAFGLSVVEGMRFGVPAIVTDSGGNPEVTHNGVTGYVIHGQNPEEFAKKIIQLIDDEMLYKEMSSNSIKIFNEKFTASVMSKNTERYYLEILGGNKIEEKV